MTYPPAGYPPSPQPAAPGWGTPGGYAVQRKSVSGLAIASLVTGLLFCLIVTAPAAVVLGYAALDQIKASNGWKTGRGMAIAGIVLGYLTIGSLAVTGLVWLGNILAT